MSKSKQPTGYWRDKDKILSAITTTKSRSEFQEKYPGAAVAAKQMGIYEELTTLMVEKGLWQKKNHVYWTKKSCIAEIRKYKTVTDLLNNNMGAYLYARKHGFGEQESARMEKRGSLRLRKIYVFEFEDGYAYVGLSYNPQKREKDHLRDIDSAVYIHLHETQCPYVFKELSDFLERKEASEKEEEFKQLYKRNGWVMLNRMKCGGLGALGSIKYSKEQIRGIASKYDCRSDFNENDKGAYLFAYKNGWLDEVCAGMPKFKGREEPTDEEIQEVVHKCKNRTELKSHHTRIWNKLVETGLIEVYYPKRKTLKEDWPDERILEVIRLCNSRTELMKEYRGAYDLLKRDGRIDLFFPFIRQEPKQRKKSKTKKKDNLPKKEKTPPPTKEEIRDVVMEYETKMDFYHAHPTLYNYACKMRWLDEIFKDLPKRAKRRIIHRYWTEDKIANAVKDKPYKSDFRKKYPGAYDLLQREGRLDDYFKEKKEKGPERWNDKALHKIVKGCKTPADLGRKSRGALQRLIKDGRLDEFFPNRVKRKK